MSSSMKRTPNKYTNSTNKPTTNFNTTKSRKSTSSRRNISLIQDQSPSMAKQRILSQKSKYDEVKKFRDNVRQIYHQSDSFSLLLKEPSVFNSSEKPSLKYTLGECKFANNFNQPDTEDEKFEVYDPNSYKIFKSIINNQDNVEQEQVSPNESNNIRKVEKPKKPVKKSIVKSKRKAKNENQEPQEQIRIDGSIILQDNFEENPEQNPIEKNINNSSDEVKKEDENAINNKFYEEEELAFRGHLEEEEEVHEEDANKRNEQNKDEQENGSHKEDLVEAQIEVAEEEDNAIHNEEEGEFEQNQTGGEENETYQEEEEKKNEVFEEEEEKNEAQEDAREENNEEHHENEETNDVLEEEQHEEIKNDVLEEEQDEEIKNDVLEEEEHEEIKNDVLEEEEEHEEIKNDTLEEEEQHEEIKNDTLEEEEKVSDDAANFNKGVDGLGVGDQSFDHEEDNFGNPMDANDSYEGNSKETGNKKNEDEEEDGFGVPMDEDDYHGVPSNKRPKKEKGHIVITRKAEFDYEEDGFGVPMMPDNDNDHEEDTFGVPLMPDDNNDHEEDSFGVPLETKNKHKKESNEEQALESLLKKGFDIGEDDIEIQVDNNINCEEDGFGVQMVKGLDNEEEELDTSENKGSESSKRSGLVIHGQSSAADEDDLDDSSAFDLIGELIGNDDECKFGVKANLVEEDENEVKQPEKIEDVHQCVNAGIFYVNTEVYSSPTITSASSQPNLNYRPRRYSRKRRKYIDNDYDSPQSASSNSSCESLQDDSTLQKEIAPKQQQETFPKQQQETSPKQQQVASPKQQQETSPPINKSLIHSPTSKTFQFSPKLKLRKEFHFPDDEIETFLSGETILEISVRPLIYSLSEKYGYEIHTIREIPEAEFQYWKSFGFQWVWLYGAWQLGEYCLNFDLTDKEQINRYNTELPGWTKEDVIGYPLSIVSYQVNPEIGNINDLIWFRNELKKHNIRLMLDYVPNHTAVDAPEVTQHPEYYIRSNNKEENNSERFIINKGNIAFGAGINISPMKFTAQLNMFNKNTREMQINNLQLISRLCDGVRVHLAHFLINDRFYDFWKNELEEGGFEKPKTEFWEEAIEKVRKEHPGFVMMAESYGFENNDKLIECGFNFVYNKELLDYLVKGDVNGFRKFIFDNQSIIGKMIHFVENHDENRMTKTFYNNYRMALTASAAILTLPGIRLINYNQWHGYLNKVDVNLRRAVSEDCNQTVVKFYNKLLNIVNSDVLILGKWTPLNVINENGTIFAWKWSKDDEHVLVTVNFNNQWSKGSVICDDANIDRMDITVLELISETMYKRSPYEMRENGLKLSLEPYQAQIFQY